MFLFSLGWTLWIVSAIENSLSPFDLFVRISAFLIFANLIALIFLGVAYWGWSWSSLRIGFFIYIMGDLTVNEYFERHLNLKFKHFF